MRFTQLMRNLKRYSTKHGIYHRLLASQKQSINILLACNCLLSTAVIKADISVHSRIKWAGSTCSEISAQALITG